MRPTLLALAAILLIAGCTPKTAPLTELELSRARIDSLESTLFADKEAAPDPKMGMKLVREYAGFYKQYPSDSLAVDMLFKAGEVSMGIGQGNLAIKYFEIVSSKHADFERAPEAVFLSGFCSENLLADTAQARFYYSRFIEKFPEHHLAEDARFSIQNLGMSDEELIRMFEEKLAKGSE